MKPVPPTGTEAPTTVSGAPSRRGNDPQRTLMLGIAVGIALVLAGIGAIIISGAYDEPKEVAAVGRNLPVNEGARNALDLSAHNSPTLARNPRDEGNLVEANRVDSPVYSCALAASFDGGGRWSPTAIPAPSGVKNPKCYAPDVTFGSDGTLYLSFVTLKGRANVPDASWLSTSTDGGKTLSQPVRTPLGKRAFQSRVTADPRQQGRIYLTWLAASDVGLYKFTETGNPIQVIRSDDGGRSWTQPVRVSNPDRVRALAPAPAIGPDGKLYVLYLDVGEDRLDYEGAHRGRGGAPYDGQWKLVMTRSTDRGAHWQESEVGEVTPTERFIAFSPPFPAIAVDGDRVYAAFQDGGAEDADVNLWSLAPGATSWKGPKRVNDNQRGDGTSQYLPKLGVSDDGRLDVVYYDRRANPKNVLNEVSLQSSFDHGDSFTERVRLSDAAFSSRIGFGSERGLPDLGNRLAVLSTDSAAFAAWSDTRGGTRRSGKQDIATGIAAVSDPPRLADWLESLLRWGGVALILLGVVAVAATAARSRRPA